MGGDPTATRLKPPMEPLAHSSRALCSRITNIRRIVALDTRQAEKEGFRQL
jgi:hypothetical protein